MLNSIQMDYFTEIVEVQIIHLDKFVDTSLDVHSEVTGNVTFQDTVLAHARIELDMNTCRPLVKIVKYYFTPICTLISIT